MKLSIAKRHLVNQAIAYAQRVTKDVARYAFHADEYVATVRRNAKRDKILVLEAAATHIEISRSAGTTYKQLRKLYPPLPGSQLAQPSQIPCNPEPAPPTSNTGETFPQAERPGGFLACVSVNGETLNVFDILGDYV